MSASTMTRRQAVGALAAVAVTPPLVGGVGAALAAPGAGDAEVLALGREIEDLERQRDARWHAREQAEDLMDFHADPEIERLEDAIRERQWIIAEAVPQTLRGVAVQLAVIADWQVLNPPGYSPADTALANARTALEQIGGSL